MGPDGIDPPTRADEPRLHWSGLPSDARKVAWLLLIVVAIIDGVIHYATLRRRGWPALAGGENLLGFWDLAQALAVGIALIYTAGRTESRPIAILGALFLLVGIEDQIEIHGRLGDAIADLFQFQSWIPGIGAYGAHNIGEFVAMALFGVVAFVLVWTGRAPTHSGLRRARIILTGLLVLMFFFAVVVDLVTAAERSLRILLVEELGERGVLSLAAVYSLSLASIKTWTNLVGVDVGTGPDHGPQDVFDADDAE